MSRTKDRYMEMLQDFTTAVKEEHPELSDKKVRSKAKELFESYKEEL